MIENQELRADIDRVVGEWLKTHFALARASWGKGSGHDAMDHLQYLHLSQYEAQLTPKLLAVLNAPTEHHAA